MSVSRHPIALRLEKLAGDGTQLLATVMALPLIDGIFVALILAGTLNTVAGILETGLLIFGGSATLAVILAEMDGTRKEQVLSVLLIGALIIPVAAIEAVLAVTIESVLNMEIFTRFAGLVILAVAAKTASSKVGEWLPSPGVIVGLGLVASVEPSGFAFHLAIDPELVARAVAAAGVGVLFALGVAGFAPGLRGRVDIDRFRFGSSVALGVLALTVLGIPDTDAPIALAVLLVTALFAYNPDAELSAAGGDASAVTDGGDGASPGGSDEAAETDDPGSDEAETGDGSGSTDRDADGPGTADRDGEIDSPDPDSEYGYPGEDDSRAPWL